MAPFCAPGPRPKPACVDACRPPFPIFRPKFLPFFPAIPSGLFSLALRSDSLRPYPLPAIFGQYLALALACIVSLKTLKTASNKP